VLHRARGANQQALAFVYCEDEPGRRTTGKQKPDAWRCWHLLGGPPIEAVRQMVDERVLIGAVEPPGGHRLCCIAVRWALVLSPWEWI
jgi:hypothetical protein